MRTSDSLDALAPALAKAQAKIGTVKPNAANPFFKSKYADLPAVWDTCKEALNSEGLTVIQGFEPAEDGLIRLSTLLLHTSGQFVESTLTMQPTKSDPQAGGSAITYMQRYSLKAIAMVVAAEEDDDGSAASGRGKPVAEKRESPKSGAAPIDPDEITPGQKRMIWASIKRRELQTEKGEDGHTLLYMPDGRVIRLADLDKHSGSELIEELK